MAQLCFLIFPKQTQFSPITDAALHRKTALLSVYAEIYREHLFGSPGTFFVNCVFLACLFVLQLGLLCLVRRSKPCQHITLFIRQRCYRISLRLEETPLSNNYRIYICVVPLRETLKRSVECQDEGRIASSSLNGNKIRWRGTGRQIPTGGRLPVVVRRA